jgi:hypothetical protein
MTWLRRRCCVRLRAFEQHAPCRTLTPATAAAATARSLPDTARPQTPPPPPPPPPYLIRSNPQQDAPLERMTPDPTTPEEAEAQEVRCAALCCAMEGGPRGGGGAGGMCHSHAGAGGVLLVSRAVPHARGVRAHSRKHSTTTRAPCASPQPRSPAHAPIPPPPFVWRRCCPCWTASRR